MPSTLHARTPSSSPPAALVGAWTIEASSPDGSRRLGLAEGESLVVGSSRGTDVVLDSPGVSPQHCRLAVERGELIVRDLGSGQGVHGGGGGRVAEARFGGLGSFAIADTLFLCSPFEPIGDGETEAPLAGLIGESASMRRLARLVRKFAPLRASVLVRGETGSGKELVAAALHRESQRRDRPYVPLNMGALPPELADAELFGHERGAFTGAFAARRGAFESANGGSIFLDEIAELPQASQSKLLRTLECGEVRPLGTSIARKTDARVIAATWQSLGDRVAAGSFREDLFHRLAVLTIDVPPLRDRLGDVPRLARAFLAAHEDEVGPKRLHPSALARLSQHSFPGNVRELKNMLLRAALLSDGPVIGPAALAQAGTPCPFVSPPTADRRTEARAVFRQLGGNVSQSARALGVSRTTVRRWMEEA